jgi:hypothetical protein
MEKPLLHVRPKFIASLTFRGFDTSPKEVQARVGKPASLLVARGEARRQGTTPFQKSAASWKMEFADSARLDEMIPALIESLGGVENLLSAKNTFSPEFFEFDISMWIKDSEEQEGGLIDAKTIAMLSQLGAGLSFGFYARYDT